jgi:signal transduction histidine kinase
MPSDTDRLPRLISLAVHELLTPLTVVSGYLRMLLREQAGPITEKQRKMLEEAERSSGRIGALIAEMRALGKLESGEAAFAMQEVDIAALLAELASSVQEGKDRGVRLELRGIDRPVMVTANRASLTAALKSLLHSVLREQGEAGAIIGQCSTYTDGDAGYAVLAFSDVSLLAALTRDIVGHSLAFDEWRGGTGMALPIARCVIEAHGGAVWSAATQEEIGALYYAYRCPEKRLSDDKVWEFTRKRTATALRLPLTT